MKRVLLFGDSNTWGAKPIKKYNIVERYDFNERYGGVLQKELGDEFLIIEEGNPGRTTIWEDPIEGFKNGREYLIPCLDSHQPLDLVVVMLGTNDLKVRFSLSAFDIAQSAGVLVGMVQSWKPMVGDSPKVLLVAPPPIRELPEYFKGMFEGAYEKSRKFSEEFKKVAETCSCMFFDASKSAMASDIDGVHYEKTEHQKLGKAIAAIIKERI